MKRIINLICAVLCCTLGTNAQDSLSTKHLEPYTYVFDVVDGELVGEGKTFLEEEVAKAQYTMIGEYHGSKRISEFTNAIIPALNKANYKVMALEVGPITGNILNNLEGDVASQIKEMHQKYLMRDADGDANLPFPFFSNREDAQFLQSAKNNNWQIFGIDQEFYDGLIMLSDVMFKNLSSANKSAYKEIHKSAINELRQYYQNDMDDKQNIHVAISQSPSFQNYLVKMGEEPKNTSIIDAIKKSSAIYLLYHNRQWYKNNATRISYMKSKLREGLESIDFDIANDKMLIKMGGYHLSKGFSPLSLYEVGNTLNELAEYHGNSALNIGFMSRFYEEDSTLKDNSLSENRYFKNRKPLLQMGQKTEWVVIDLRKLRGGFFYYPQKFKLNTNIAELIQRYDLLVIPKTEIEGISNY